MTNQKYDNDDLNSKNGVNNEEKKKCPDLAKVLLASLMMEAEFERMGIRIKSIEWKAI